MQAVLVEVGALDATIASLGVADAVGVTAACDAGVLVLRLRLARRLADATFAHVVERIGRLHAVIDQNHVRFHYVVDLCACDHVPFAHMHAFVMRLVADTSILQVRLCSSVVLVCNRALKVAVDLVLGVYTPVRPFKMLHVGASAPGADDEADALAFLRAHRLPAIASAAASARRADATG